MSKALKTWAKHVRKQNEPRRLPLEERKALAHMRAEARAAGASLAKAGVGGLPPSLVLGVMRRDGFTCKVHGDKGEGEFGGIQVHHKAGVVASRWLDKKGHANQLNNIVTVCTKGHDEIHNRAREQGIDSSQIKPEGDMSEEEKRHMKPEGLPWRKNAPR